MCLLCLPSSTFRTIVAAFSASIRPPPGYVTREPAPPDPSRSSIPQPPSFQEHDTEQQDQQGQTFPGLGNVQTLIEVRTVYRPEIEAVTRTDESYAPFVDVLVPDELPLRSVWWKTLLLFRRPPFRYRPDGARVVRARSEWVIILDGARENYVNLRRGLATLARDPDEDEVSWTLYLFLLFLLSPILLLFLRFLRFLTMDEYAKDSLLTTLFLDRTAHRDGRGPVLPRRRIRLLHRPGHPGHDG